MTKPTDTPHGDGLAPALANRIGGGPIQDMIANRTVRRQAPGTRQPRTPILPLTAGQEAPGRSTST